MDDRVTEEQVNRTKEYDSPEPPSPLALPPPRRSATSRTTTDQPPDTTKEWNDNRRQL